jgi:hypothetical protein
MPRDFAATFVPRPREHRRILAALRKRRRRDPPDLKPEIGDFCLPAPARTRAMLD